MAIYDKLPKDPVMLLSFINTQLRDTYDSFEDFAHAFGIDPEETMRTLRSIDYEYDPSRNQFV